MNFGVGNNKVFNLIRFCKSLENCLCQRLLILINCPIGIKRFKLEIALRSIKKFLPFFIKWNNPKISGEKFKRYAIDITRPSKKRK